MPVIFKPILPFHIATEEGKFPFVKSIAIVRGSNLPASEPGTLINTAKTIVVIPMAKQSIL